MEVKRRRQMKPSSRDRVTHRKEQKQGQGLGGTPAPSRKGGDSAHRFWSVHRPLQPLAPGSPALPQGLLGVSGATRSGHRPSSAVEPGALGSPHPAAPCVTSRLGLSSRSGRCQNDCSTLRRSATSRPPFSQNLLGFTWQVPGAPGPPPSRDTAPRTGPRPSRLPQPLSGRVSGAPRARLPGRSAPGPRAQGTRRGRAPRPSCWSGSRRRRHVSWGALHPGRPAPPAGSTSGSGAARPGGPGRRAGSSAPTGRRRRSEVSCPGPTRSAAFGPPLIPFRVVRPRDPGRTGLARHLGAFPPGRPPPPSGRFGPLGGGVGEGKPRPAGPLFPPAGPGPPRTWAFEDLAPEDLGP